MKDKFLELFKEVFELEDEEVKFEDNFRELDTWDSLTHLSLIAMMDDEYDIQIEEEELKKLITVSDIFEKVNFVFFSYVSVYFEKVDFVLVGIFG